MKLTPKELREYAEAATFHAQELAAASVAVRLAEKDRDRAERQLYAVRHKLEAHAAALEAEEQEDAAAVHRTLEACGLSIPDHVRAAAGIHVPDAHPAGVVPLNGCACDRCKNARLARAHRATLDGEGWPG